MPIGLGAALELTGSATRKGSEVLLPLPNVPRFCTYRYVPSDERIDITLPR
ncbi:MAG: hypothetical protein M9921_13955 [Fimbriimonadaceae bacterium]|nr:hypothetical protein [Fimbriimonadaceae bacterium]